MKPFNHSYLWLSIGSIIIYAFYYFTTIPVEYATCKLCDGNEYAKLYNYFEIGQISQIAFPFYLRPIVPFLSSLMPLGMVDSFQLVNFIFYLLAILALHRLWNFLNIQFPLQLVGFGWMLFHWMGIIRYNLADYVNVDVPLYFVQAITLWLFLKKKYKWFYLISPLAILQKESFVAIMIILILVHVFHERSSWLVNGKHLIASLILGLSIQFIVLSLLPEQVDKRTPFFTVMYLSWMVIDDPTRIVRWFAAVGGVYGILLISALYRLNRKAFGDVQLISIIILSVLYLGFGLLAGGDMTRILMLGFPYLMTWILLSLKEFNKQATWVGLILSFIVLRIFSLQIDPKWAVDYADPSYVFKWAGLYSLLGLVYLSYLWFIRKRNLSKF